MDMRGFYPPIPVCQSDFDTAENMRLSLAEIIGAITIKLAVMAKSDTLRLISDYELVQYSLTTHGESIDMILHRISMMQSFREEYQIDDTPEQGVELISQCMQEHPGHLLSIEYIPEQNNFLVVLNWQGYRFNDIKTYEQCRIFIGSMYYLLKIRQCQFRAMREGLTTIMECTGAAWENLNMASLEKVVHELFRWYPKKHKQVFMLNSPGVVNFAIGILKRILPHDSTRALQLGMQIPGFEGQDITELYRTPIPESASQKVLVMAKALLEIGYRNEKEFTLAQGMREIE